MFRQTEGWWGVGGGRGHYIHFGTAQLGKWVPNEKV